MTRRGNAIFSHVQLGPYELRNRLVMALMTRNRAREGNAPTQMNATYYAQRVASPTAQMGYHLAQSVFQAPCETPKESQ